MGEAIQDMIEPLLAAARRPALRACVAGALFLGAGCAACGAVAAALALVAHAAYVEWGWVGALLALIGACAAVAGVLAGVALGLMALWRRQDERRSAAEAIQRLREELDAARRSADASGEEPPSFLSSLLQSVAGRIETGSAPSAPALLLTACIAGAGLAYIGPGRALRLLLRARRLLGAAERFAAAAVRPKADDGAASHGARRESATTDGWRQ